MDNGIGQPPLTFGVARGLTNSKSVPSSGIAQRVSFISPTSSAFASTGRMLVPGKAGLAAKLVHPVSSTPGSSLATGGLWQPPVASTARATAASRK